MASKGDAKIERARLATRRELLAGAGAACLAAASGRIAPALGEVLAQAASAPGGRATARPNILIIMADQLAQKALGAYGDKQGATPNIDALARRGLRFETAYVQCPLCMPLRASLWTGRYPHETTVMSNYGPGCGKVPKGMTTLGDVLGAAGYECAHFGKTHDGGALRGFDCAKEGPGLTDAKPTAAWPSIEGAQLDRHAADGCIEFIRKPHEKPFVAVASLLNPHNICGWCGTFRGVHDDPPIEGELPPLPDNHDTPDLAERPLPIQYLCCSHRRLANASKWSGENYRHYLAAYYHYTRLADNEVGRIVKALDESPAAANTMIVFLSDHGDGMASHRMTTKDATFQEETTRVPLIFAGAGVAGANKSVGGVLVSLLDLVPTICRLAGAKTPPDARGLSLAEMIGGAEATKELAQRQYVVSEWYTEAGFAGIVTPGRMVRTERYKYVRWIEGDGEELYDLKDDPGEKKTLIKDPAHAKELDRHRELLKEHVESIKDPFFAMKASRPGQRHELGYPNHPNDGPGPKMSGWVPPEYPPRAAQPRTA